MGLYLNSFYNCKQLCTVFRKCVGLLLCLACAVKQFYECKIGIRTTWAYTLIFFTVVFNCVTYSVSVWSITALAYAIKNFYECKLGISITWAYTLIVITIVINCLPYSSSVLVYYCPWLVPQNIFKSVN